MKKNLFNCLLIANRGEIVCRIVRTARRLNISTVAVYTPSDARSRHRASADVSILIGDYLNIDEIIAAALKTGADAVHPGYGFLSESAEFSRACEKSGLVFIGPPPEVMATASSKSAARRLAATAGVDTLPGFDNVDADDKALRTAADNIGYPLLIKAEAGGGGRGMRICRVAADFDESLAQARRESMVGFGSNTVILEKYIPRARHLEAQLLCDNDGNIIILGERDCTLQRRHQKLLEESPAPGLSTQYIARLHDSAKRLAAAMNYRNIGTAEFLLNSEDNGLYFLEVNARLQVEHPVTEMVYGIDLVHWQLRLAAGEKLPNEKWHARGAAIEARICAENPLNNFLPSTGILRHCNFPVHSASVRVDSGVDAGDSVGTEYDSMLAKVIAHGDTRAAALRILREALAETHVTGVATNIALLHELAHTKEFELAQMWTAMIDEQAPKWMAALQRRQDELVVLAAVWTLFAPVREFPAAGFRLNAARQAALNLSADGRCWKVTAEATETSECSVCLINDDKIQNYAITEALATITTVQAIINGQHRLATCDIHRRDHWRLFTDGLAMELFQSSPTFSPSSEKNSKTQEANTAKAPMNAVVSAIAVSIGDIVKKGATLLTVEAMKMEMTVAANTSGVVKALHYDIGDRVEQGAILVELETDIDT